MPVNADVVITDSVPAGTTLVADSISEGGDEQDGTITWTLEDQAPGASGQVSFKVTVTEDAAGSTVDNSARDQDWRQQSCNKHSNQSGAGQGRDI